MKIAEIQIGKRHRKDMGDLQSLADSIAAVGLLQPIVVTEELRLVAGMRRIEATKLLGKDGIKAVVVKNLTDAGKLLRAEHDENTCRKDLSPTEAVAMGKALEPLAKKEAKSRQAHHARTAPGRSKNTSEKFTGVSGESRDQVAAAVGMSGPTYEKAKAVVEAAEADPSLAPIVEELDRTGKVDPAYKKITAPKVPEPPPAEEEAAEEGVSVPLAVLKSKGIELAYEAINLLKKIRKNDPRRTEGLKTVARWIKANI